jgi:hypothetical protein
MTPEMRAFEYALALFAVLIGLAIVDIATSFHRLLRRRSAVKWDPLALLAALYALCMAIYMWFDLWGVRHFAATRHFVFYLALIAEFLILFLIAASSLPDDVSETTNLRDYYTGNRRYFWFLVALFQLGYVALGIYFVGVQLDSLFIQMLAPLIIAAILAVATWRWVHYAGLALLFAVMLHHYAPAAIN